MRIQKKVPAGMIAAALLCVLILDTSTALEGAGKGLELCLKTVIPSLFPFIFISSWMTSGFQIENGPLNRLLCKLFHLPEGSGVILLSGLLGGYPVGARCVGQASQNGQISSEAAKRMIVFCNAAGPSFLFGMVGTLFSQTWIPWVLWAINLCSAFLIARILPAKPEKSFPTATGSKISLTELLRQSVKNMAEICGWIILIRVLINILQKWILWLLPQAWAIGIIGILELSNGCMSLHSLECTGLRFVLCALFLGFGGFCVSMQTRSAAQTVDPQYYLPGKIIQAGTSFLLACLVQRLAFRGSDVFHLPITAAVAIICLLTLIAFSMRKHEKSCGILETVGV